MLEITPALLERIINEGHPYHQPLEMEGTCESGPYALTYYGVRWGRLQLCFTPSGSLMLFYPHHHLYIYHSNFSPTPDPKPWIWPILNQLSLKATGHPHWTQGRIPFSPRDAPPSPNKNGNKDEKNVCNPPSLQG